MKNPCYEKKDMEKIVRTPGVKTTCFSYYDGEDKVIVLIEMVLNFPIN